MSGELREEPPVGAVLKCALVGGLVAESAHSGVYLGGGRVAELRGDGALVAVSPSEFLNGVVGEWELAVLRTGFRIYTACDAGSGTVVGSAETASRARALTEGRGGRLRVRYDLTLGNCHRFAAGCVAGRFGGEATEGRWTLGRLEEVVSRTLNGGRPLVWRAVWPETPGFRYAATTGKQLQHWALVGAALGLGLGRMAFSGGVRAGAADERRGGQNGGTSLHGQRT